MEETQIGKKKKDTFNTLLGAVELRKLIRQYLFVEDAIHSTPQERSFHAQKQH